jgi:hypothetical protein
VQQAALALAYARAYPEEIGAAIADNEAAFDRLAAQAPPGRVTPSPVPSV